MSAVMKDSQQFRSMTGDDIPRVMQIEKTGHAFPWTEGIFNDCIRVGYRCVVLEENGSIIAYGVMSVAAGEAHVFNVAVDIKRRNEGLGRKVMEKMMDDARTLNANSIFLEVRPSNVAAVGLYESLGFNQIGHRKDYYPHPDGREDALIFAMDL
jgi:ribosomal-protein-alanine N-acetyltransferase